MYLRQIRGKSCKEARYGSSRIKGEIQRNKKKNRNTKKKVFRPNNPSEAVMNGSRALTTIGFLQATNLLEKQPETTTKAAPNKKDSVSKNGSKSAAEVGLYIHEQFCQLTFYILLLFVAFIYGISVNFLDQ